jgi:hypothetical protein
MKERVIAAICVREEMKGLNLSGVAEFCRVLTRQPQLLLPQLSVKGTLRCL